MVGQATWILGIALATGAVAHSQVRRARELESIRLATFTGTTSAAALPAPGNAGRVPQLRPPPPPKRKVSDYDADSFNEWADATAVAP